MARVKMSAEVYARQRREGVFHDRNNAENHVSGSYGVGTARRFDWLDYKDGSCSVVSIASE
ncbi:MAG: hypothetical protein M3Y76_06800 [Chloroflexota bacterium]|nr:hypothetical protein [Chloroflexota bacterium]